MLGWIFPRGIVAAAVSSLFALRLEDLGYPGADKLVPMVFTVIVGTVVIQSLSGRAIASWLGIRDPEPTGVLVVGANRVARFYARALQEAGHRVLLASMNWRGISEARMAGLPVFYGSAVSSYGERHMNLLGLGKLLALSGRPGLNELACVKYRHEFGRPSVYTVRQARQTHEKHQVSGEEAGRLLYGGERTMEDLEQLLSREPEIRTTEITDSFSLEDYRDMHPGSVALFITSADGSIRFPLGDDDIRAGDHLTAAVPPADKDSSNG